MWEKRFVVVLLWQRTFCVNGNSEIDKVLMICIFNLGGLPVNTTETIVEIVEKHPYKLPIWVWLLQFYPLKATTELHQNRLC